LMVYSEHAHDDNGYDRCGHYNGVTVSRFTLDDRCRRGCRCCSGDVLCRRCGVFRRRPASFRLPNTATTTTNRRR